MFGSKDQVRTFDHGDTNAYAALAYMTIDRAENRGTLQVTDDGNGKMVLKCVNHHFLSCRNDFKDKDGTNAVALRDLVKSAVDAELDAMLAGLKNAKPGLSDAEKKALDEKFAKVKKEFDKAIEGSGDQKRHEFSRKAIGAILQRVNALKESLSVQGLMRMDIDELTHLADSGKVSSLVKNQMDSLKYLDQEHAKCKEKLTKKIDASSLKPNMVVAQKLLDCFVKDAKKAAKSQSKWIGDLLELVNKQNAKKQNKQPNGGDIAKPKDVDEAESKSQGIVKRARVLARGVAYDMLDPRGENGGPLVCLTKKQRDDMKNIATGLLDNLNAFREGRIKSIMDIETDMDLLEQLVKDYQSRLDAFTAAYNDALADFGIRTLQIDDQGNVKQVGEDKVGQVREDCKRLLDLLTAASDSDGQSVIGINTSFAEKSKLKILKELDTEMLKVMDFEAIKNSSQRDVDGSEQPESEPPQDWGDDWETAKEFNLGKEELEAAEKGNDDV